MTYTGISTESVKSVYLTTVYVAIFEPLENLSVNNYLNLSSFHLSFEIRMESEYWSLMFATRIAIIIARLLNDNMVSYYSLPISHH